MLGQHEKQRNDSSESKAVTCAAGTYRLETYEQRGLQGRRVGPRETWPGIMLMPQQARCKATGGETSRGSVWSWTLTRWC